MVAFPTVLRGTQDEVVRGVAQVARDWADDLRASRPVRALATSVVASDDRIYCSEGSDFAPTSVAYRLFSLRDIRPELKRVDASGQTDVVVEQALLAMPAGVLWLNVGRPEPNTAPVVLARLEALFSHWQELASLSLFDRELVAQPFEAVVEWHYSALLSLWSEESTGSLRERLHAAIDRCASASVEVARVRIAARLAQLAPLSPRVLHPERFADADWIIRELATVKPRDFDAARTGVTMARLLHVLDHR